MATSTLKIILQTIKQGSGETDVKKGLMGIVGSLTAVGVASAIFGTLVAGTKAAIAAASEAETAEARLTGTMISMGRGGEEASEGILKTANALMRVSTFDDETIIGAYTALAKFDSLDSKGMDGIVKAAMDMTAVMGGDLPANAEAIGRILETGLIPRTMAFDSALKEQVKSMIESGNKAGALNLILGELNQRYGGQAVAQLDTYAGSLQALKNAQGEYWEAVGNGLAGPGKLWTEWITNNINRMTEGINAHQAFTRAQQLGMDVFFDQINGYYELNGQMITAAELIAKVTAADEEQAAAFAAGNPEIARANTYINNLKASSHGAAGEIDGVTAAVVDYSDQLSKLSSYATDYTASAKNIADAEAKLAELRKKTPWDVEGINKAELAVNDLKDAQDKQTASWMVNILQQQLAADGLSEAEMEFLLQYQVDTGLMSEEAKKRATDQWKLKDEMKAAFDKIEAEGKDVAIFLNYYVQYPNGMPPELPQKNQSYDFKIPPPKKHEQRSPGGPFEGWALVGDAPGGILTEFTELVYAPHGAMVYSAAETRKMLSHASGGPILQVSPTQTFENAVVPVFPVVSNSITQLQAIASGSGQNDAKLATLIQSNTRLINVLNEMLSYIKDQPQTFARAIRSEIQSGWNQ